MSKSARFLFFSFIISLFFPLILSAIFFFNLLEFQNFKSLIIGWGIVFIGFVTELFFVQRGMGKSDKLFIRNVLGAISIRLFLTLLLVIIALSFLELSQNNFIFSILFFFIFYLIIEIFYLTFRKN
jgi:hypothetical protein